MSKTLNLIVQKAVAARDAGELDKALSFFARAIALASEDGDLNYLRGWVNVLKRDWQAAISDFTSAIEKTPGDERAYFARGCVYYRLKDYAKVRADLALAPRQKTQAWHQEQMDGGKDLAGLEKFYLECQ